MLGQRLVLSNRPGTSIKSKHMCEYANPLLKPLVIVTQHLVYSSIRDLLEINPIETNAWGDRSGAELEKGSCARSNCIEAEVFST